jgi:hypothetical protein
MRWPPISRRGLAHDDDLGYYYVIHGNLIGDPVHIFLDGIPMSRWQPQTVRQRLEGNSIPEPNSGCWLWEGCLHRANGYGKVGIGHKAFYAHRLSWLEYRGSIPKKMYVLHSCDNPGCVNPDHLFIGTQADNLRDMHNKGRSNHPRGEQHSRARLTEKDVRDIRASELSYTKLARLYGVLPGTIGNIRSRRIWKHIQ